MAETCSTGASQLKISKMVFNIGNSIQAGAKEIARLADEIAAKRRTKE